MFGKKNNSIHSRATHTLIGEGTVFEGRIRSGASIRIEGQITGDIQCEGNVTVGEQGVVKSNISAKDVVIAGIVHGNVMVKGRLTITSKGQLLGNTNAPSLIVEEGGVFQGSSKMEQKPAESAVPSQTSAASPDPFKQTPTIGTGTASVPAPAPFGGNPVIL